MNIINPQDFEEEKPEEIILERRRLMKNAAKHFKLAKDWENAADAYLKAAEIEREIGLDFDESYIQAATMKINYDTISALKILRFIGHFLFSQDQFLKAARVKQQIGEIYESEKEYLRAAKNYEEAFEMYEMQEMITPYDRFDLLLKAADLNFIAEPNERHILEAIHVYEAVASQYSQAHIDAKEFYFKIVTLHLANNDILEASQAFRKFQETDPNFKESRTYCYIENLIKDFRGRKFAKFQERYHEAGIKTIFELWDPTILKLVKTHLPQFLPRFLSSYQSPRRYMRFDPFF